MPTVSVADPKLSVKSLERTGVTCTMNVTLEANTRLDEIMMARKHGDLALHVADRRVPVRCDRISIKDAKIGTFFVQHSILERHGVSLDDLMNDELRLEFSVDAALFSADEMNPRPGKAAKGNQDAGQKADPEDDADQPEPATPARKPRKTPGGKAARA